MSKTKKLKNAYQSAWYFVTPKTDEERFWTNKLKAVIYVRVSSEGQVTQWHGLESQETICRERCKRQQGLEIETAKVFREEGVSGKLMDRKAMNDAIKYLEKENKKYTKIHYFVVTDADRIARPDDIAEAFTLEQRIEGLWVRIITVNNKRDTETDEWKFLHTIQYAIAGLERRKILRRTMNGRLSSMKNGGRPFPKPPLGYLREKQSEGKWYSDIIDALNWPIIRESLELYAYNPLFSQAQLQRYLAWKGIQGIKSKKMQHSSVIEKMFKDYRLYFYAGYIYYPEWGIDEPLKWKHEGLISLDTVNKILEKEATKIKKIRTSNVEANQEINILHGMITCCGCGKKLGCYDSRGNGGVYSYYTCNNKYCEERMNAPKELMEKQFEELIETMKLPKQVFDTFKAYILEERNENKKSKTTSIPQMQGQLLSLKSKMEKIEEKILSISNEWLTKKMEEEWSTLETLQEDLLRKINNQKEDEDNIEETLSQIECIITDPVGMRKNSNYEIRQLLFMVRFGGVLYYKKKSGYRTNETTGLHSLFQLKNGSNSTVTAQGGTNWNQLIFSEDEFNSIISVLLAQSKYIQAIHKVCKIHGWDISQFKNH